MDSKIIVREIVKLFRKFNLELPQKHHSRLSRRERGEWTYKVLDKLNKLRDKLGNSKNLEAWSRLHNGEWIWDFCLCRINGRKNAASSTLESLLVVAESEWGNEDDIKEDFEKLLVARALVRVMIYDARKKGKKSAVEIARELCEIVKKFNRRSKKQPEDTYLLVAAEGEKSDFRFFKIENEGKGFELLECTTEKNVGWGSVRE